MAAPTATGQGYRKSADRPLRAAPRKLPFPLNLYQTSVGKKWVMAVTGLMLIGFVFAHMIGNLKLYLGVVEHNGAMVYDADAYAHALRTMLVPIMPEGVVLWLMRLGLIAAFGLHIHSAYSLTRSNMVANRTYESKRDWLAANFASRSMRYSGIIVGAYLLFHLADLTWGWTFDSWEHGAVQANVTTSMSNPVVAIIYIVASVLVSIHIYHGMYSMFQSLGINNPSYNNLRRLAARGVAAIICLGNISFPIAVLADIIQFDPSLITAGH